MKKFFVISFAAIITFGFTFTADTSPKAVESDCPYINEIHSKIKNDKSSCPFIEGKISEKKEIKSGTNSCPFTGKIENENSKCPFLNKEENQKTDNVAPAKHKKLKIS